MHEIKESDLEFKGENPGSVIHGNFINYYKFNDVQERLKILPQNIWSFKSEKIVCLDIGCNAGDLTAEVQQFISKYSKKDCSVLGIDIDQILINRAIEKHRCNRLEFTKLDFVNVKERDAILGKYLKSLGCSKFNVIFCFSITMWIHLNNGDDGVRTFLKDVCNIGEIIIVEPQTWKSYKTAVKRLKLTNNIFPLFNTLRIRNNVEEEIENTLNLYSNKLLETDKTKWNRKLLIYTNIS